MNSLAPTDAHNPYLRADSLTDLLSWHDVDFVRCAYATILGRQPDPEGESYYTARLRQGRSKREILWHLSRSEEGRRHDPGIGGFGRELKRAARARSRLIGWFVRLFTGLPGDSVRERQLRALMNSVHILARDQQARFQELKSAIGAIPSQPQAASQRDRGESVCARSQRQRPDVSGLSERASEIFLAMSRVR